jgi:hypothetical protein
MAKRSTSNQTGLKHASFVHPDSIGEARGCLGCTSDGLADVMPRILQQTVPRSTGKEFPKTVCFIART